jgi:putative transcriptional regulator
MFNNVIEVKLEELLTARNKSLNALHNETGISYNTLINIKKRRVKSMTFDVLEKICKTLDCKPNDLLVIKP